MIKLTKNTWVNHLSGPAEPPPVSMMAQCRVIGGLMRACQEEEFN